MGTARNFATKALTTAALATAFALLPNLAHAQAYGYQTDPYAYGSNQYAYGDYGRADRWQGNDRDDYRRQERLRRKEWKRDHRYGWDRQDDWRSSNWNRRDRDDNRYGFVDRDRQGFDHGNSRAFGYDNDDRNRYNDRDGRFNNRGNGNAYNNGNSYSNQNGYDANNGYAYDNNGNGMRNRNR